MMDDDAGATEDVQSLLDDLEREMAKVARRCGRPATELCSDTGRARNPR